jgi:hypothetical protein
LSRSTKTFSLSSFNFPPIPINEDHNVASVLSYITCVIYESTKVEPNVCVERFSPVRMDPVPGPISLPTNATFVSDADEEIFLLYTRLAALKPPDSTDADHFHGLGSENSQEDALVVHIEITPPPTAHPSLRKPEKVNRKADRRNRVGRRKGSGSKSDIAMGAEDGFAPGHRGEPEPFVFEYQLFQDKTALRSRSGDTGSVLWKAR